MSVICDVKRKPFFVRVAGRERWTSGEPFVCSLHSGAFLLTSRLDSLLSHRNLIHLGLLAVHVEPNWRLVPQDLALHGRDVGGVVLLLGEVALARWSEPAPCRRVHLISTRQRSQRFPVSSCSHEGVSSGWHRQRRVVTYQGLGRLGVRTRGRRWQLVGSRRRACAAVRTNRLGCSASGDVRSKTHVDALVLLVVVTTSPGTEPK